MGLFIKKHYGQEKAKLFFLNTAISFTRLMATSRARQRRKSKPATFLQKPLNTVIVAGHKRFNACLQLAKHAALPMAVCGRIAINAGDHDPAIGITSSLKTTLKKNQVEQIVFCEGEQSFKVIIEEMESIPSSINILVNAENSSSMVGSNNKNTKGIFIAPP